jgi:hypothetical protein
MLRLEVSRVWLKVEEEAPAASGLTESQTGLDVVGLASTDQAE